MTAWLCITNVGEFDAYINYDIDNARLIVFGEFGECGCFRPSDNILEPCLFYMTVDCTHPAGESWDKR